MKDCLPPEGKRLFHDLTAVGPDVLDVHSDTDRPSFASGYVPVPETGCPDMVKHVK